MKTTKSVCRFIAGMAIAGLISCQNPIETSHNQMPLDIPPDGKGSINISLETSGEMTSRTVKPQFDFKHVVIQLVPHQATPFGTVEAKFSRSSMTIDVFPGNYRMNAYLYAEVSDPLPIAKGTVENIEIVAGKSTFATVTLRLVELSDDYTGQGIFTWELPSEALMSTMDSASIRISKDNTYLDTINLLASDKQRALNVGYYSLRANFENMYGARSQALETLWVYKNQTSCWDLSYLNGSHFYSDAGTMNINWKLDTGRDPLFLTQVEEVEQGSNILFQIEDGNYHDVKFYLDTQQIQEGISTQCVLSTAELASGSHEVAVISYGQDGIPRSASVRFIVRPKAPNGIIHVSNESEFVDALKNIASSLNAEATICIDQDFSTNPVILGQEYTGKRILLTAHNGEKSITLASAGSLFTISPDVTMEVDKGLTLKGIGATSKNDLSNAGVIRSLKYFPEFSLVPNAVTGWGGNIAPLIHVRGNFILKGSLRENSNSRLKQLDQPLAIGGIHAEGAQITIDGGTLDALWADHHRPYESYYGQAFYAVAGIFAEKNSKVKLVNATITNTAAYIEEDPSFAVSAIFLDTSSTAELSNTTIEGNAAHSGNFQSFVSSIHISQTCSLTMMTGTRIIGNINVAGDLYNNAGTIYTEGKVEMAGGEVAQNKLFWNHRYPDLSFIFGSSGIYIGSQGRFLKTGGKIYGTGSPYANECLSVKILDGEQERGAVTVGATAYYAADNRTINATF